MRHTRLISSLITLSVAFSTAGVRAAPKLRKQVDQRGDFVLFGNTLGWECANNAGVPAPVVGSVDCPGGQGGAIRDTAPDVFWRSDSPSAGEAEASQTLTAAQARSTAVLSIPTGATVTYARIYWAGMLATPMSSDDSVRIEIPSASVNQQVAADDRFYVARGNNSWYQSTADITSLVTDHPRAAYRISDVASVELDGLNSNDPMVGWVAVVLYSLPSDPPRNLALFDGLDFVASGGSTQVTIDGFLVPNSGFDARLGVVAYEGEQQYTGDALSFNGVTVSNAANPANNFFNSSRSYLGTPVSNVGDLPQLTGAAASMAGVDLDVVDVKPQLKAGDTSATIRATSGAGGDAYALGGFVTAIATFKPDFSTSGKTFTDLNGAPLMPGDVIEYTVTITNTGNDASANTVVTDALPKGVTYVPGSMTLSAGPGSPATFTDAAGDDAAEYTASSRTLTFRVGTGASKTAGGSLVAETGTATVKFKVTIDADASGSILNQAVVTAEGALGAPSDQYPTDGNGNSAGVPPTQIVVDQCGKSSDCKAPTPLCDTASDPNVCVECVADKDCTDPKKPQCGAAHTCGCTKGCTDTDGDGISDMTETQIGTDPKDADSDDDGVKDGDETDPTGDPDMDGLINALDPDSDNDGLFDGTELGLDCSGPGTAAASRHCIPDADGGRTKTDPLDADTDNGGATDGAEDINHDGAIDKGETDPTAGHGADDGDLEDSDGDGLSNGEETAIGSDPNDADSDDDGVKDGEEANPADDSDGDGVINVRDPDSDNDGLKDGTELGFGCDDKATDKSRGFCVPDADAGATVTSPLDPDTDHGGVSDGNEDKNLNGKKDAGETDPTLGHGADDGSLDDSDGDGLSDDLETKLGTDPADADSDDDGVKDGDEPNFADDTDGDGTINALDPDSDGDGLFDGTELGKDCSSAATSAAAEHCIADADGGRTTTSPLDPDTDRGGVRDGDEDKNHDGQVDSGETDPNDPSDDDSVVMMPGTGGSGGSAGSLGAGGDGTSTEGGGVSVGGTEPSGGSGATGATGATGTGASGAQAGATGVDGVIEGGGCDCRTAAPASSHAPLASLVSILGGLALVTARRRRRR